MSVDVNEVIEVNNKEYICYRIIEHDGVKYIYLISNFKPAEFLFAKEVKSDTDLVLEIINDNEEKNFAFSLLEEDYKKDN